VRDVISVIRVRFCFVWPIALQLASRSIDLKDRQNHGRKDPEHKGTAVPTTAYSPSFSCWNWSVVSSSGLARRSSTNGKSRFDPFSSSTPIRMPFNIPSIG
jgi:hypothetical protein